MKASKLFPIRESLKTNPQKLSLYHKLFAVGTLVSIAYLVWSLTPPLAIRGVIIGLLLVVWCGYFYLNARYWRNKQQ